MVHTVMEVSSVERDSRLRALEASGLLHPRPELVSAELFRSGDPFFLAADKVQVKYEMLRAHAVEGLMVAAAARSQSYSRAEFYVVLAAFEQAGMTGLLDSRRGRKGPLRLTPEIVAFVDGLG